MTMYLQMDGVDDVLTTPVFTFTSIEMDVSIESKSDWGKYISFNYSWFQRNSNTINDQWDESAISVVLKDGAPQTNLTPFVTLNERHVYRVELISAKTVNSYVFASMSSTIAQTGGKIYDVKFYNGSSLAAHYDMSTGTVQDQSGNGNDATLNGGTWLDDGAGGTAFTANLSDSLDPSDAISKALSLARSDTILASESERDEIRCNLSDTIVQTDSIVVTGGKAVLLADSFALMDGQAKAITRAAVESVGVEDSIGRDVSVRLFDVVSTEETFMRHLPDVPPYLQVTHYDVHLKRNIKCIIEITRSQKIMVRL